MFPRLKSDAVFSVCLIIVSAMIGFGLNMVRAKPLQWIYQDKAGRLGESVEKLKSAQHVQGGEVPAAGELERLGLVAFLKLREDKTVMVLDARPAVFFELGHVPGALSLPRDNFEEAYVRLGMNSAKGRALVVYCASDTCEDAGVVRAALVRLGHAKIMIFHGGWSGWQAAGLVEEKLP